MPIVNLHILEGRTVDQKRKLVKSVTEAICTSLDVPADKVRIIVTNMDNDNYSIAGKLIIDSK